MKRKPTLQDPREAALRTYAAAYDRFAETEQMHVLLGNYAEAEGAHAYALWAVRAYKAEMDDPEPRKW